MKYIIKGMLAACLFYPMLLNAQNEIDALRYSQNMFGSTARSFSMGGAFGALGADFSSLSGNPGGLGVYRKSEFTLSMGFNNRNTETEYILNKDYNNRFSFDLPNLGMVFSLPSKNADQFRMSIALGYNRTANFNSESTFGGKNRQNSLLDSFIEDIQQIGGISEDDIYFAFPYDAGLAYDTYLLNPDTLNFNQYISVIPDGEEFQSQITKTWGGMGEYAFGMGFNIRDKVQFGFTFGFPTIRYEEDRVYEERDIDDEISVADSLNFRAFRYDTHLRTTGNGFNFKFGVIVKPIDWLRLGAAVHTPTYYFMHDNYHSYMYSAYEGGVSYEAYSPEGSYSYNLTTPFRAIGSLAFIFGKFGLVSFDYEITDYSGSKLDASDYNFSNENKIIDIAYSNFSSNLRGGLEYKYQRFSFRAGVAYYTTPFESAYTSDETNQESISYTAGIGFREKRFFIDLGYGYTTRSESFTPYTLVNENVPASIMDRTDNRFVTTFGFRF